MVEETKGVWSGARLVKLFPSLSFKYFTLAIVASASLIATMGTNIYIRTSLHSVCFIVFLPVALARTTHVLRSHESVLVESTGYMRVICVVLFEFYELVGRSTHGAFKSKHLVTC
jgi:hypothetical protein